MVYTEMTLGYETLRLNETCKIDKVGIYTRE